jgi:hypothetical protein
MEDKTQLYLAYFDSLGFECIICLSDIDKKKMWAALKGESYHMPAYHLIMRAKANPQRFPEIWTFWSSVSTKELTALAEDEPQALADGIRNVGTKVFVTPKEKEVIR